MQDKWKSISATAILGAALIVLNACGSGDPDTPEDAGTASVPGVTDNEILLGSHTDLSGPTAIWGVGSINGARMRFDEANEAGGIHGRQIRFIVEDTGYQVPRAIQAANKLLHRDKIFAMTFALGTQINNTILPGQMEAGIPNLFPYTGARSMNEPFRRLQFTQRGVYYDEIRAGVRYSLEELGKTTPCIIHQDTDYGHENLDAVIDQAAEMKVEVAATAAHKPTETEFTATVLRLRNAGCDVVFMGTVYRDTVLILEAARKMGWDKVSFVGNDVTYGDVVSNLQSGASEGFSAFGHIAELYRDDDLSDEVAAWYDRYEERYGEKPVVAAVEGYRGADLIVEALEIAGKDLNVDSLIVAMESITDYTDMFGYKVSFGPNDHKGVSESVLSVVEDGRWVTKAKSVSY
ncbi:MAG: ABC transporter substrate-binding protein [Woeseiaceae bacterium]